jgi:hypothetical protein
VDLYQHTISCGKEEKIMGLPRFGQFTGLCWMECAADSEHVIGLTPAQALVNRVLSKDELRVIDGGGHLLDPPKLPFELCPYCNTQAA